MTDRELRITIVRNMVNNGYHRWGKTIEEIADMMSLEDWQRAEKKFLDFIKKG